MRGMRTKLSVCLRKTSFESEGAALLVAGRADVELRSYRCDRCGQFHLTGRTKGKRMPRPDRSTP